MLKFRLDDHRGYGNNHVDTATGSHFNQPGHSLADMSVTVLEQVRKIMTHTEKNVTNISFKSSTQYRKE